MPYLLGTDEAGYGPNLGPLLIGASLWEVPDGVACGDLYRLLRGAVVQTSRLAPAERRQVWLADSKSLYQAGQGLADLEAGLWPVLGLVGCPPRTWRQAWHRLAPGALDDCRADAWYDYDCTLPIDAGQCMRDDSGARLAASLARVGVRLAAIVCRAVFPAQFNRLVEQAGSKGTALSQVTLELAAQLIATVPDAPVQVVCDKHGGRNHYQHLLQQQFPDWLVEVHREGGRESWYRFGPPWRRVEFRFVVRGEQYLPVALASMAAKYLRELAMRAWNTFWCARVPGLAPTAGYPGDAQRFKDAIAAMQQSLGIADEAIWRHR